MKQYSVIALNQITSGTGEAIDVRFAINLGIDVSFTGTATGSVAIETCSDLVPTSTSTWRTYDTVDIAGTSPDIASTDVVCFHWIRAKLTIATGSLSACKVVFYGKGV
jgi:hypothetical protein